MRNVFEDIDVEPINEYRGLLMPKVRTTPPDVKVIWSLAICWAVFAMALNRFAPGLIADLALGFTLAFAWDRIRS